jgi:hypothetical protein
MAYTHSVGVTGTVTVPAGKHVLFYSMRSLAGGTVTITPFGGTAQAAISTGASGHFDFTFAPLMNVQGAGLGPGSTLVFAATDEYLVVFV